MNFVIVTVFKPAPQTIHYSRHIPPEDYCINRQPKTAFPDPAEASSYQTLSQKKSLKPLRFTRASVP